MKLEAHEITATSARMEWRHLDEQEEKPDVDGVQVRIIDLEANIFQSVSYSSFVASNWTPMEFLSLTYPR